MKEKYLVRYYDVIKKFKTKGEIMEHFQCPLYIIDKIIRKINNPNGKCHLAYSDLYKDVLKHPMY